MRKLLLSLALLLGGFASAQAQQTGCTVLSLTVGCYVYPQAILQVPQILPDGSPTTPSIAWANSPTTGVYRDLSLGYLHFSILGTDIGHFDGSGMNGMAVGQTVPAPVEATILTAVSEMRLPHWVTSRRPSTPTVGEVG